MIKNLKRTASVLLAAVLLITSCSFAGFSVSAAEIDGKDTDFIPDNYGEFISNEELGEIVSYGGYISKAEYQAHINNESVGAYYSPNFVLCTDTGGNAIRYVSSADGVHSPGTVMYQIEINGQRAYCIQPGVHTSVYVNYSDNAIGAWNSLSVNQQQAINTALCFGREGNFGAIASGTTINSYQAYCATQVIIWEIVRGVRNPVAPFSLYAGEGGYIGLFCAGGENPNIREAYNRIVRAMSKYTLVPSFAEYEESKAPLISLRATYNSLRRTWSYESVTLNDNNGVLGTNFAGFNNKVVDVGTAKVTIKVSGNKITFTPSNAKLNGTQKQVTVSCEKTGIPQTNQGMLIPYAASGYQDIITGGSIDPPSAYFQLQVVVDETTKLYSDIRLRKVIATQNEYDASTEDYVEGVASSTENLEGWYFRVRVNKNSDFYLQYGVSSFDIGPTDKNGFTESFSEYIMKHFDYSRVQYIVPSDYYYVEELGKKLHAGGTIGMPDFYTPLRNTQEIHFSASSSGTQIHYNISHYTNIFTIPIEVLKTTDDGSTTANYYFRITNRDTGEQFEVKTTRTGTHDATTVFNEVSDIEYKANDGHYFIVLPEGRYTLTELGQLKSGQYKIPKRFAEPAPVDFEVSSEEYKLAQQNGYRAITISVANKCEGYLNLTKTEEGSDQPVEGAVYGVFSDEDCMELIYQMPPTDQNGKSKSEIPFACNSPYYVKEIKAPTGYQLSENVYNFMIEAQEKPATEEIVYDLGVADKPAPNPVEIRKTDITGSSEIVGAVLELRASDGTLVEKWTSGRNAHVINDIAPGTYTLTETIPANGYVTAEKITFTVQKGGEVTQVTMKDAPTKIQIIKVDENNAPVKNADLQVLDSNGDVVVNTWTTDGSPYTVTGKLIVGQTYKLHEVKAPDGYLPADDVEFTVGDTADTQSVKMVDQPTLTRFNKVDEKGNPVRGATLQLFKSDHTKITEWVTDGTAKEVKGLTAGATYILRESKAPDGYVISAEVSFTVKSDGSITTVTMTDKQTVSKLNKVDGNGNPVIGATLQLFEANGTKVDEWVTNGTAKEIKGLTAGARYILRESKTPDGYTTAKDVSFTVRTNGSITTVTMTDKQTEYLFSKVNDKGQRIAGAELQILDTANRVVVPTWISSATEDYTVKGILVVGKKYKLHEVKAPNGYSLADDIEFEVKDSLEPVTITMVDLVTGVYINKVNTSGELVENAHLRLTDKNGNVKGDWYTSKLPKEIKGLTVGDQYTLTEIKPPVGYVTSPPVTFTVKSGVTLVKMTDYPITLFFAKREPGSENFISGAHLQILDTSGTVVEDWITDNGYHIVTGKLEIGKSYVLHEAEPPKGRAFADDIPFTVADTSSAQYFKMYDPKTMTYVSKFSITGQEELAGALLSITDSHNNVIAEWTSTNRRKLIYGLVIGEEYTLTESISPCGYATTESVKFTINADGSTTTVIMRDAPTDIQIEKLDKLTNRRIADAKLQLFDSSGTKIDEWTSSASEAHTIKGTLIVGQSYRLHEVEAPDGFCLADDVEFTVRDTSEVQSVKMYDTPTDTYITKTDITGRKEVIGATLTVKDSKGKVIDEWVSADTPHEIRYLVQGASYTLTEKRPASGYVTAESIIFSVNSDGTPTRVEMRDAPTKIHIEKIDALTNQRIANAVLQVFNSSGTKVDEWTSSAIEAHDITGKLVVGQTYRLHEATAPNGYNKAEDVRFTIRDTSEVQLIKMKDTPTETYIAKMDITGENEVIGATLTLYDSKRRVIDEWVSDDSPHEIRYLVQGASYTLTEKIPASGYVTAESIKFSVRSDGTPTRVEMRDAPTKIQIIKVDNNQEPLRGVQLQILDAENNVVIPTWTTDGNPHDVTGRLVAGQTYKLHEVKALQGYDLAQDVTFTVRDTAEVQTVKMVNTKSLGSLIVHKQDSDGNPLNGSEWQIYNKDNTQLRFTVNSDNSYRYNTSGRRFTLAAVSSDLIVKELPIGDYYLVESKAPNGRTAYGKKIPFSIKSDSEASLNVELTVKDNNIIMYNTGSIGSAPFFYAGVLSLIAAIAAVLILKRKTNQKQASEKDAF